MTIKQITEEKKQFLDLLLLGDEQESMIDRYLDEVISSHCTMMII